MKTLLYSKQMAIESSIAIAGIQTLARNTRHYYNTPHHVALKTQRRPLLNFPVNANRYAGGLKPIKASIVPSSPLNNNNTRVSDGVAIAGSKDMSGWHEIELVVREYELDKYGVVNNGVYSNYCQIAHYAILERAGLMSYDIDSGMALALTELSLKFISPLKSGDRFLLRVRISGMTMVRVTLQDAIIRLSDQKLILEANATAVYLDKKYRPMRLPQDVRSKVHRFVAETQSEQD